MQVIFAGSLIFFLIDILFVGGNGTQNLAPPDWYILTPPLRLFARVTRYVFEDVIQAYPLVFFAANMFVFVGLSFLMLRWMKWLRDRNSGGSVWHIRINRRIDLDAFQKYLKTKDLEATDGSFEVRNVMDWH